MKRTAEYLQDWWSGLDYSERQELYDIGMSHTTMLEALKQAVLNIEWAAKVLQVGDNSNFTESLKQCQAAIAQAEGTRP